MLANTPDCPGPEIVPDKISETGKFLISLSRVAPLKSTSQVKLSVFIT